VLPLVEPTPVAAHQPARQPVAQMYTLQEVLEGDMIPNDVRKGLLEKDYMSVDVRQLQKVATDMADEIDRAMRLLGVYGVSQERARNRVSTGIEVLVTRMDKENIGLRGEVLRLKARLHRIEQAVGASLRPDPDS
jgi:hypothetical protein